MRRALTGCAALALLWASAAHADDKNSPAAEAKAEAEPAKKLWKVGASAAYRTLLIDEDPRNGMALVYGANASGKVFDGAKAYIGVGLYEGFTAVEDESGFLFQDTRVGFKYATPIDLGGDRELGLTHDLRLFLPTSRASANKELYVAPMLTVTAQTEVTAGLAVSVAPHFRYRFHGRSQQEGPSGRSTTQFDTGIHGGVDYTLELGGAGELSAGVSAGSVWLHRYDGPSPEEAVAEARANGQPMLSTSGAFHNEQTFQLYDYGVSLAYTPLAYVTVAVGAEQAGSVLRNGVVNTFIAHRDETEYFLSVSGRY